MAFKYSAGAQPISSTISSIAGGTGLTSFTVASATGLPTIGAGEFGTLRIADGTANAETLTYSLSGTTVTCSPTGFAHSNGDAVAFDILSAAALTQIKEDAISGYPENLLTTGGALVKGSGVTNRITISSDQTFTLANGTYKGELCRYRIDRTSAGLATIDPAGTTTIDGALTRVQWAGEWGALAWTGTEWEKIAGYSRPMSASATLAQTVSVPGATNVKIDVAGTTIDNGGLIDSATNKRINIKRAGKINVVASVQAENWNTAANLIYLRIVKNGTTFAEQSCYSPLAGWPFLTMTLIEVPVVAGDYIEVKVLQGAGGTQTVSGKLFSVTEADLW